MNGYISYPTYPKSFKAKRKLLPKVSKHRINERIQLGVKEIILEHELGRGESEMENVYRIDNAEVKITYNNGNFHAYVREDDRKYDAPIETKIEFEYAKDQYDRDYKVMNFTEDKYRLADDTNKRIEESSKLVADLMALLFLIAGIYIAALIFG